MPHVNNTNPLQHWNDGSFHRSYIKPATLSIFGENMIITSQESANGINRNVSNTVYGDIPFFNLVMPNRANSFAIVTVIIECSQDGLNEASFKIFDNNFFKGSPKTYKQTVANAKVIIALSEKISPLVGQTISVQVKNPTGILTVYGSPDNQSVMNSLEIT